MSSAVKLNKKFTLKTSNVFHNSKEFKMFLLEKTANDKTQTIKKFYSPFYSNLVKKQRINPKFRLLQNNVTLVHQDIQQCLIAHIRLLKKVQFDHP